MGEYPRGSNNNNADDEADEGDRTEICMIYVIDLMSNWGGLEVPSLMGNPSSSSASDRLGEEEIVFSWWSNSKPPPFVVGLSLW